MSQYVSILTYNIHKGFGPGKVSFQLPKMREALLDVDADLLLLQEVQGEHKRQERFRQEWPSVSQCEYLAEMTWPHRVYAKNAVYQSGHHGNAVLSKFEIIASENRDLSTVARASRSLLYVKIAASIKNPVLHVFCVHFGLFKSEREHQVLQLQTFIQKHIPANEPLIIAGDFNDWHTQIASVMEGVLGLNEALHDAGGDYAKSFPAWRATLALDRIYYRGLNLKDAVCLNAKPWRTLSDHLPLWALFEFI